jgi:hypothetical protein
LKDLGEPEIVDHSYPKYYGCLCEKVALSSSTMKNEKMSCAEVSGKSRDPIPAALISTVCLRN